MLFSASEADSRGEGSALASRKLPEIGGVDVSTQLHSFDEASANVA